VGVNPSFLSDQHLVAESAEITMIFGQLVYTNWKVKGIIPKKFTLGTGHMNFFKNKLNYLRGRLASVNVEMINREFVPGTNVDKYMEIAPIGLCNDWSPDLQDSLIVRNRIVDRLLTRSNGKLGEGYYKYRRSVIDNIDQFSNALYTSEINIV